jgi:hypothetical protein
MQSGECLETGTTPVRDRMDSHTSVLACSGVFFVVALFVFVLCLVTNVDCVSELYSHFHVGFRERGYNNSIYNKNKFIFQQAITSYFTYDDELL